MIKITATPIFEKKSSPEAEGSYSLVLLSSFGHLDVRDYL